MNQHNSNPVTKNQTYHSSSNPFASHPPPQALRFVAPASAAAPSTPPALRPTKCWRGCRRRRTRPTRTARGIGGWWTWGPGDGDDDPILQLPLDIGLFWWFFGWFFGWRYTDQTIGLQNCILHTESMWNSVSSPLLLTRRKILRWQGGTFGWPFRCWNGSSLWKIWMSKNGVYPQNTPQNGHCKGKMTIDPQTINTNFGGSGYPGTWGKSGTRSCANMQRHTTGQSFQCVASTCLIHGDKEGSFHDNM